MKHPQTTALPPITNRTALMTKQFLGRMRHRAHRVVDQNLHPISHPLGESPQSSQTCQQPIRAILAHKIAHQNRLLPAFRQCQHLSPPRGRKQLCGVQHVRGLVPHARHQLNAFGLAHANGRKAVKQRPIARFQHIKHTPLSKAGSIADGRDIFRRTHQEEIVILPGAPNLIAPNHQAIQTQVLSLHLFPRGEVIIRQRELSTNEPHRPHAPNRIHPPTTEQYYPSNPTCKRTSQRTDKKPLQRCIVMHPIVDNFDMYPSLTQSILQGKGL